MIALTPYWLMLLFGLALGSFNNVLIYRIPRGASLLRPVSSCPGCSRPIRPWENVPLFSWLFLRGRCSGCGMHIPFRYPLVEALTGLLFLAHGAALADATADALLCSAAFSAGCLVLH